MSVFKGQREPAMALDDAVAQGLVTVELRASEEGVTSRAIVRIVSRSDRPLRLRLPAGLAFVPEAHSP